MWLVCESSQSLIFPSGVDGAGSFQVALELDAALSFEQREHGLNGGLGGSWDDRLRNQPQTLFMMCDPLTEHREIAQHFQRVRRFAMSPHQDQGNFRSVAFEARQQAGD